MSDNEPSDGEPKIIVDDDWKSQVQKEKESGGSTDAASAAIELPPGVSSVGGESEASETPPAAPESSSGAIDGLDDLPPASFEVHITMLFTQCMAALGQVPGEDGKPGQVSKPYAKLLIDTVEMLETKTAGNRTDDETKMLSEGLHAMRMAYVNTRA